MGYLLCATGGNEVGGCEWRAAIGAAQEIVLQVPPLLPPVS